MKCHLWWILILIFVGVIYLTQAHKTENFDILGALAPYKDALYRCERDCEREDPSKRLLAPGNIGCDAYCQSTFTNLARNQAPSPPVVTEYDECEEQCSKGPFAKNPLSKDKCISMCHCHTEVKKWCRDLQCAYTDLDSDTCMKRCIESQATNCNQLSWTWKKHG
mgnify:FL=1